MGGYPQSISQTIADFDLFGDEEDPFEALKKDNGGVADTITTSVDGGWPCSKKSAECSANHW